MIDQLNQWWWRQPLERQFLLAGSLVAIMVMVLVGWIVTSIITSSVTRNAAANTALYVDSVIAPLLPDMQKGTILTDGVKQALNETLDMGALGKRIASFKLWRLDGTILYSKNPAEIGQKYDPNPDLQRAWLGQVVAQYNDFDDHERLAEGSTGVPLLEIYYPILQPWSGDVVSVSEFYEVATDLQNDLWYAVLKAWAAVAALVISFFACLYAIVRRGGKTIELQSATLNKRVAELTASLRINKSLRVRVQEAAQRATAVNERHLKSIGADLHDGPAQLIALASLGMETDTLLQRSTLAERRKVVASVREALDEAMLEIRSISNGLVLPNLEDADLREVVGLAARAHEQRTSTRVELDRPSKPNDIQSSVPVKICAFRFVQEALNNAFRHAGGIGQRVRLRYNRRRIFLEVSDAGKGFGPEPAGRDGIGLSGLRDRVESLGGLFRIKSSLRGTKLTMVLNGGASWPIQ